MDVPGTLLAVAAAVVVFAVATLVSATLYWLTVRAVNLVTHRASADPPLVPPPGYPKAVAAAFLIELAQIAAAIAVVAPAVTLARVDMTVVSARLILTVGLMWLAVVAAAAVVTRLLLPARTGAAVAVGMVYMGVQYMLFAGAEALFGTSGA